MNKKYDFIKKLSKLPISALHLIILNEKIDNEIREFAKIEIKNRFKNYDYDYEKNLKYDAKVIEKRGSHIKDYLIGREPNLDLLMELFLELYINRKKNEENDKPLLISEYHLCNYEGLIDPFFTKICDIEIDNLTDRIDNIEENNEELKYLKLAKEILIDRQKTVKSYQHIYNLNDLSNPFFYDELAQIIDITTEYNYNISKEELYKREKSLIKSTYYNIIEEIYDSNLFDSNYIQLLFTRKKQLEDSKKLNYQKRVLLNQVKTGHPIDYTKIKVLKKVL